MALFKIYRGNRLQLPELITDGYAYFIKDEAKLYIDAGDKRYCLNAEGADKVLKDGEYVETSNLVFNDQIINVAHGGTGATTLTKNAVLIGNGTDTVQLVVIPEHSIVVHSDDTGITGLAGTGALYSNANSDPQFGTLPLVHGGTGATTEAEARKNLQVYSTGEVDDKLKKSTSVAYTTTLTHNGWQETQLPDENKKYSFTYNNSSLICGSDGNVPPIVTYTTNLEEYSKIDSAMATPGVGITFYSKEQPEEDIEIIVIDVM